MKLFAWLGLLAGLALLTVLVVSHGIGAIWHSATTLGLGGFAAITAWHCALFVPMGTAWWLLGSGRPGVTMGRMIWSRAVRDSASEALPLSQLGGYLVGARAATLAGAPAVFSAASTVVDVSMELMAQLAYTAFGLVLLEHLLPGSALVIPVLAGTAIMAVLAAVFLLVQARGAGAVERIGRRMAREVLGAKAGDTDAVQAEISAIHARRGKLVGATFLHFLSWVVAGVETWLTFRLMGVTLSVEAALAIDSILYGMRSVAFMVPGAIGVQEGGLVFLGGLFGVPPDAALALSLVRRGRDLVIGAPVLLAWQAWELRQARRVTALP